jgi:TIR domain/Effector-associated domain 11
LFYLWGGHSNTGFTGRQCQNPLFFTNFLPNFTRMKEQIQQLIANGQTEDALALLAKANKANDAMLLQAQYNNGKRNFNMGLIDFSEWGRIQARVNFAALELAGQAGVAIQADSLLKPDKALVPDFAAPDITPNRASVFISYNHEDTFAMRSVKGVLEKEGIKVFVDIFEMKAGESIQVFIDKALQDHTFILSLISKNSLVSGWVNVELTSTIILDKFGKKWIPVRLDDACFDTDFYFKTLASFDEKIERSRSNMQKALTDKVDSRPFQDELNRLEDLKSNFGKIIQTLKSVLVVDISGKVFDLGIQTVVSTIQRTL